LYASYNDQIGFLIVYIREAHPEMLREGNKTGILGQPKNLDERVILATECVTKYKFTMPMVIDGMEGKVNDDYQAWPVRAAVTDIDGNVAYYGGPGPAGFSVPPVERVLKKLIANGGRLPPTPEPKWGQTTNGLRCGLSLEPQSLLVGEDVVIQLKFENTTNRPLVLYCRPDDLTRNIAIENGAGQALQVEAAGAGESRAGGRSGRPFQRIAPGGVFETEIEGKIVSASSQAAFAGGGFNAVYHLDVDEATLAQVQPRPAQSLWTGKLSSGTFVLNVAAPPPTGCVDCHGAGDHHHKENQKCEECHAGDIGSENFKVKEESCAHCHPREGVYGRRQILGPGGEFELASRHFAGAIEDKDCLLCHDNRRHRTGVVNLIDPDSGGTKPWTGTRTGFCLTCHDGEPPAHISFPDKAGGSGFDKMKFLDSPLAQIQEGCSFCHAPHGSAYPSLLKDLHSR
jgi:predicted CXXCH cytochrome family protein